jgi:hypothetical protein
MDPGARLRSDRSIDDEALTQPPHRHGSSGSIDVALETTPPAHDGDLGGGAGDTADGDLDEDRGEPTQMARIPVEEPAQSTVIRRMDLPGADPASELPGLADDESLAPVMPAAALPLSAPADATAASPMRSRLMVAGGAFLVVLVLVIGVAYLVAGRNREPVGTVVSQPVAGEPGVPAAPAGPTGPAPAGEVRPGPAVGAAGGAVAGTIGPDAGGPQPAAPAPGADPAAAGPAAGAADGGAAAADASSAAAAAAAADGGADALAGPAVGAKVKPATAAGGRKGRAAKRRRRR